LNVRSTLIYLIIALLLGGLYLWDVRSEKEEKALEEEAKVLFPGLDSEKLERIELERGDETIVLRRIAEDASEASWTITSPVKTGADDFSVNRITSLLPHLKYTRIIEQEAEDAASFGLGNPADDRAGVEAPGLLPQNQPSFSPDHFYPGGLNPAQIADPEDPQILHLLDLLRFQTGPDLYRQTVKKILFSLRPDPETLAFSSQSGRGPGQKLVGTDPAKDRYPQPGEIPPEAAEPFQGMEFFPPAESEFQIGAATAAVFHPGSIILKRF